MIQLSARTCTSLNLKLLIFSLTHLNLLLISSSINKFLNLNKTQHLNYSIQRCVYVITLCYVWLHFSLNEQCRLLSVHPFVCMMCGFMFVGELHNSEPLTVNLSARIWLKRHQISSKTEEFQVQSLTWSKTSLPAKVELVILIWRFHHDYQTWLIPINLSFWLQKFISQNCLIFSKKFWPRFSDIFTYIIFILYFSWSVCSDFLF